MKFVALFLVAACSATAATTSATVETTRAPTTAAPDYPPLVGPAGNGLIAYSYADEIFIGDPVTGTTKAIVTGAESHTNPSFSPDGTRIAFVRGDPYGDASLMVVQADGSDERVAMPEGFSKRGVGPFAWTPDSLSLVVGHDREPFTTPYWDGELSLFDASGVAEPRLLTPPLPLWIGGSYFNPNAQVAPMFRPPDGDLILSPEGQALNVWDGDLQNATELLRQSLDVRWPTWSPDGAMIMFMLDSEAFVMNPDGADPRLVGDGWSPLWSPDSNSIAFERLTPDPDGSVAVIVIINLGSGAEEVLEATSTGVKSGTPFHTITNNTFHTGWYYEGWSWSPDGRSLLILESHRTRPWVVDVETGRVTELPWEADSAPSWQRVASG